MRIEIDIPCSVETLKAAAEEAIRVRDQQARCYPAMIEAGRIDMCLAAERSRAQTALTLVAVAVLEAAAVAAGWNGEMPESRRIAQERVERPRA